ncbi:P-loop containing nucleoside triphosphate hydrolase protein [Parasitella parasitica]|nr:P-loop containing nucleoside triphosphate hydrolase protein [Parasitella parasitica]
MEDCDFWGGLFLTPCIRERYLNTILPSALVVVSCIMLVFETTKARRNENTALYKPINQKTNAIYGAASTSSTSNNEESNDDVSTSSTVVSVELLLSEPWSAYNWTRLFLSGLQLGCLVYMALSLDKSNMDVVVEGRYTDLLHMYYARIIFWTYAAVLALLNICLSLSIGGKSLSNSICTHLNYLYILDFIVQLVNITAYYQVHDILEMSQRYQHEVMYGTITLVLLVAVSNESRCAPASPIITDTGRVMSGENWASFYSRFMFSWVNPMMEKGNRKTLNDNDLFEVTPEKRAKNTLKRYRLQKKATMLLKFFSTFKRPLTIQFFYCLAWSVLMFGPPYFLNKIIKFIEHGKQDETVSSAFIYVSCLFLTSCGHSLCYQQALYIGRSLGIQIQSIVIGEVYSKSLRRRDEEGNSSKANSVALDKPKANVNNLLSVDAQKLGDLMAYIFYIYCFPIQITICIWSLYKLLGSASLWGVLIICLSQPVTFALSRHFQRMQHAAMKCTDKRISLVNELLSAIRIVKFFAWEKQFRARIMEARDTELKVIRARLMSYMWIGNVWFIIPVLIMVAVFYAYTRVYILTASTAFTALALFNNFKTTLDELPIITSFLLQANVSLSRIQAFLKEEEVKLPAPNTTSSTRIGFVDNASFSWSSSKSGEPSTPQIKNLNLSFPLNQMSIVCGPTGSGKTTLLLSLLGETYCLSGAAILPRKDATSASVPFAVGGAVSGIAYVAQTAWLQNCSIRDNILFGLPYDKEKYDNILYMTALTRDLEILEFGDSTEVGEKGVTLSGGQKQRVAIARAVYSQADIVILDDCLSAVDAHTAKHLYEHCLMGEYMRYRTVILVTHHVGLCIRGAGYIVALEESGSVAAAGKPLDVVKSGALGNEFSQESYMEQIDANEEAATDGPIPIVPRKISSQNDASALNGAGKLVKEETRAEGSVKWAVYGTYYYASGGFIFWACVVVLFCCAQASVLGQDYWIKVWSAAYDNISNGTVTSQSAAAYSGSEKSIFTAFSYIGHAGSVGQLELANKLHYVAPQSVKAFAQEIKDGSAVNVAYYLGVYFLIGMLSLGLTTTRSLVLFLGSLKASRKIHSELLDRILRAKVRFFDVTPLGRIVNRFSSDLETVDQAVAPSLSFLLYSVIATIYVIVLVSVITPAFIVPGFFVAMMFRSVGIYYLKTSRDMKRLNAVSRSPIYVQFNETVLGVATIRAFGCQRRFTEENYKRIDANNRPFLWMWATNRWLHCRVDVLGAFVSFCTGAVLVSSRDWVNPGLAGLSLSYSLTFTQHVLWVVRMYAFNEMNMNAIERIHEYLDIEEEPPAYIPETSPRISWPELGTVQVKNLVMKYAPDTPAVLCDISFETRPREKIGIVGRTGSGKSTLAMSLFRFMEPTSGQICIDGVDIHTIGLNDLRSRLTIIPQDPVLFSGTLRSNLDPFGQYDDAVLWAALKRSHLIDGQQHQQQGHHNQSASPSPSSSLVNTERIITLDSVVTSSGSNWSQGQRQLIALARALVKKTSLIVLDEATSSVDFDTDQQIQETIRKEFTDSTLLCIAHRIRTVADYDRILVLDQGQVKEFGTPYELMTRDGSIFQQMCERSGEYSELLSIAEASFKGHQ